MFNLYVLDLPRTPMPDDIDAYLPCEWCGAEDGLWRPDPDIIDAVLWGEVRCDECQGRIDDAREIARQRQSSLIIESGSQILDWRETDRASG